MGRGDTRPGLDGSGDGRSELCLALAVAFHAIVVDVAILRSAEAEPAHVVPVERTIDVEVERRPVVVAPPTPPIMPVVAEAHTPPSPHRAPGPAGDPNDPYAAANLPGPPAPMEAAKVLTADGAGDRPAVVSGNADGPSYGFVSATGTGASPTFEPGGGPGGVAGGKAWGHGREFGTGIPPPPPKDLSRPAKLFGVFTDTCPFPPEADTDRIDKAVVMVAVTVRPDGKAQAAHAVTDPGHGFAREAVRCAMEQKFMPALDAAGTPIWTQSKVIPVRFER